MTPVKIKRDHSQAVAAPAKKADAKLVKLMKAESDAIFTYAWEPNGTRCSIQLICGGTLIIQVNLALLEKVLTAEGMVMETTGSRPAAEAETLAKIEKLASGLAAVKK